MGGGLSSDMKDRQGILGGGIIYRPRGIESDNDNEYGE